MLIPPIEKALIKLEEVAFAPHKLSGNLYGYWACSCGYDCRIIFSIEKDTKTKSECVLLIYIGTTKEVY